MLRWILLFGYCCIALLAQSQGNEIPGIRNTGYLGSLQILTPGPAAGQFNILSRISKVNLYPGFAVVKQTYILSTSDTGINSFRVGVPMEGYYQQESIGRQNYSAPSALRVLVDGKAIHTDSIQHQPEWDTHLKLGQSESPKVSNWISWNLQLSPGLKTELTLQCMLRTSLSRFVQGAQSRDGNAFGLAINSPMDILTDSLGHDVYIRLEEGLNLTNIWGILPDSLMRGDMNHLIYQRTAGIASPENLLVWYQGAPPDFKFEKKILPFADTLYEIMDRFPLGEYRQTSFATVSRNNFSLSPSGLTVAAVLYFLMFTIPWLVLAGIVFFLIRGKKTTKPV